MIQIIYLDHFKVLDKIYTIMKQVNSFYTNSHSMCTPFGGTEMNGLNLLLCASSLRKGVNK